MCGPYDLWSIQMTMRSALTKGSIIVAALALDIGSIRLVHAK